MDSRFEMSTSRSLDFRTREIAPWMKFIVDITPGSMMFWWTGFRVLGAPMLALTTASSRLNYVPKSLSSWRGRASRFAERIKSLTLTIPPWACSGSFFNLLGRSVLDGEE